MATYQRSSYKQRTRDQTPCTVCRSHVSYSPHLHTERDELSHWQLLQTCMADAPLYWIQNIGKTKFVTSYLSRVSQNREQGNLDLKCSQHRTDLQKYDKNKTCSSYQYTHTSLSIYTYIIINIHIHDYQYTFLSFFCS